jgi:PAS domain S-box-containing protein
MKYFIPLLVILLSIPTKQAQGCNEISLLKSKCIHQNSSISHNSILPSVNFLNCQKLCYHSVISPQSKTTFASFFLYDSKTFKTPLIFTLIAIIILILFSIYLTQYSIQKVKKELLAIEKKQRFKLALHSANEGLWDIILKKKKFIYNKDLAKLLGFNSLEEINLNLYNWRNFVHINDLSQFKESLSLHIKGYTKSFNCEARLVLKDGNYKWFALHGKITERTLSERPHRITGILIDISEQKEFEHQLKLAKEKAEENNKLKSSFLANMSHEIRTPLNAIIGFSDILLSQKLSACENEKYLQFIKNSGENLLNIINDVIDFSKIESGQLSFLIKKFNLNNLLSKVSGTAHALINAGNKNIKFYVNQTENAEKIIVSTDPFRLEQILLNLVSNAIKFTNQGNVTLSYRCINNRMVKFTISDTGIGIAPKDLESIFLRYIQANNPNTNNRIQGTGLGLTITKSLVKMMEGEIKVSSELNKGTQFTISLPIYPVIEKKKVESLNY